MIAIMIILMIRILTIVMPRTIRIPIAIAIIIIAIIAISDDIMITARSAAVVGEDLLAPKSAALSPGRSGVRGAGEPGPGGAR